ncbi:hypothetical protein [Ramlibacter sp.]|uniref:hypothetical protein n=1 Tax=Ramlibacter sp. TaxID=1917967 RepID=UPI002B893C52|nr:hypothetical protein [Ramlibacter sp.]HWI81152.1 hypothetical protein [Ramlibacter sp.]
MPAFAVKHIVEDQGLLTRIMKDVRRTPYSYASCEPEASDAALGNIVYVIEVRGEPKSPRSFWLGYKYRAFEKYPPAGGGLWRERFKFKNAARPMERAEGAYFDAPVEIENPQVTAWLREKAAVMAEMPEHLTSALDALLDDPARGAKRFA